MSRTAYKGYLIIEGFDGMFNVSKGGSHVTAQPSLQTAKGEIDLIATWDASMARVILDR